MKVSVNISLTLKLGDSKSFEFIRPTVEFSDIDSEQSDADLRKHLDRAREVAKLTWETAGDLLEEQVAEELNRLIKVNK